MLYLLIKAALSGLIVAAVSEIARRYPGWGGLVASLPLTSLLAMIWLWRDSARSGARRGAVGRAPSGSSCPSLPMFLALPALLRSGVGFWPSLRPWRRRHAGALRAVVLGGAAARASSCEERGRPSVRRARFDGLRRAGARSRASRCIALTVDYDQRHRVELEAARDDRRRSSPTGTSSCRSTCRAFGGSALTGDIEVPKDGRGRGHPGHLRAGAQHDLPEPRAGPGRGERRARPLHRRQRARLFGLSRLPAGVHRRVRAAREPRDQGGRRGRAVSPSTRRSST